MVSGVGSSHGGGEKPGRPGSGVRETIEIAVSLESTDFPVRYLKTGKAGRLLLCCGLFSVR